MPRRPPSTGIGLGARDDGGPSAGERLGSAKLVRPIARGATSTIWEARRAGVAGFERPICAKVIHPALVEEPAYTRAFDDEARALAGLAGAGVVAVLDVGRAAAARWLILDLLEGADLARVLERLATAERRMPPGLACHLLTEAGQALGELHAAIGPDGEPYAHGDVAPTHVVLTTDGSVRWTEPSAFRALLAAPPSLDAPRGTAPYLAPEQREGGAPTPSGDVHAFAVLACELLTGEPWTEPDVEAIADALALHGARGRQGGMPAPLAKELARALARFPEERPPIGALVSAIARVHRDVDPAAGTRTAARMLGELGLVGPAGAPAHEAAGPRARSFGPARSQLLTTAPELPSDDDVDTSGEESMTHAQAAPPSPELRFGPDVGTLVPNAPTHLPDEEEEDPTEDPPEALRVDAPTRPAPAAPVAGAARAAPERLDEGDATLLPDTRTVPARDPEPGWVPEVTTDPAASAQVPKEKRRILYAPTHAPPPPAPVLAERKARLAIVVLFDAVADARRRRATAGLADLADRMGLRRFDAEDGAFAALLGDVPRVDPDDAIALRFATLAAHAAALPPASLAIGIRPGATAVDSDLDAIARARELAKLAPPGGVLLAGTPSRAVRDRWSLGEEAELAIPALLLQGVQGADVRRRALVATQGPWVGRVHALTQLTDALDAAVRRRTTSVVSVSAPPGVGASRLVAELAIRAAEGKDGKKGAAIVVADPPPAAAGTPFAGALELAAALVGVILQPGLATRPSLVDGARKLYDKHGADAGELEAHLAAIAEALLALGGEAEATDRLEERLAVALVRLLDATKKERPRLVVIDGWQRADAESRRVLAQVFSSGVEGPTLFVVIGTPTTGGEPLHLPGSIVELAPVDAAEARAIARAHHGEPRDVVTRTALLARAGGLPALIAALDDAGGPPGRDVELVFDGALAALAPAAQGALQRIALLQPRTPSWLLATELGAVGLAPRAVNAAVDALVAFGLVHRGAAGGAVVRRGEARPAASDATVEIAAGALAEVLIARLAPDARHLAEGRIADAIAAARAAGEDVTADLEARRQAWASAPRPQALGQAAAALSADDPAVAAAAYRAAMADASTDEERRQKATAGLEDAAFALGDLATSAEALEALAKTGHDAADLRRRAARRALVLGPVDAALATAQATERAATLSGAQELRAEAVRLRAEALMQRGELANAEEAASRALELGKRAPGAATFVVQARLTLARLRLVLGRREESVLELRGLLEELRHAGGPLERACRIALAAALLSSGDRARAAEQAARALQRARERGDGLAELAALVQVSRGARALGDLDDASAHSASAVALATARGATIPRALAEVEAAAVAIDREEPREAGPLLDAGERRLRAAGAQGLLPAVLVVRAALGLAEGPEAAARAVEAAENAYRLAAAQGNALIPALALARAAAARLAVGRREEAAEAADRAIQELRLHGRATLDEPEIHFAHARTLAARRADGAQAALDRARAVLDEQLAPLDAADRAKAEGAPLARAILTARL